MRPTEDTYRHKGLRKKLVQGIQAKGISDERVLAAILEIPRHFFLDSAFDEKAYEDIAFPIGEGQTISQPYTVAYQSQLLEIKPFQKVLEIGTGSAYQAVVLAPPRWPRPAARRTRTCPGRSPRSSPPRPSPGTSARRPPAGS